jgi:hypothetical protein
MIILWQGIESIIPFSCILFGHYMDDICVNILEGILFEE